MQKKKKKRHLPALSSEPVDRLSMNSKQGKNTSWAEFDISKGALQWFLQTHENGSGLPWLLPWWYCALLCRAKSYHHSNLKPLTLPRSHHSLDPATLWRPRSHTGRSEETSSAFSVHTSPWKLCVRWRQRGAMKGNSLSLVRLICGVSWRGHSRPSFVYF